MSHTTGPLFVKRASRPDNTGAFDWAIINDKQEIIAECFTHVDYSKDETRLFEIMPARANALLYAAAPDLLEACEFALETWREHWLNPSDPKSIKLAEVYVKIKRAVKKAKGGD